MMTDKDREVMAAIQVEYDESFWGGDYSKVGKLVLVHQSTVEKLGSVDAAFRATTGLDPIHIIHYSEDDLYDDAWNLLEE